MACIFCNQDVQTTRAKEKMYVWTCTKETLRCNLTCYNVQYNCIAFDLGNFYAETNFQVLHLHFWSSPLMCHPRPLFTSASLSQLHLQNTWQMCSHDVLCYDLIQLYASSCWRSHRLNWCLIEWWKPQRLFWAPVSVWSCFTLYSDRGHVIAVLY